MSAIASVAIHSSQFPDRVRRDLLQSLESRRVNHKFHYDSVKQTQKWLALHQAYSPSRTDPDCAATYDRSFGAASQRIAAGDVHIIGLGCGGGQKDTRLIQLLQQNGRRVVYTPADVSVAMVLTARQTALAAISAAECHPFVCDLAAAEELTRDSFNVPEFDGTRLITFFGMMPNFEPDEILPRLAGLLQPADYLLLSANLAPGADYAAGVQRILPLYENALTREWLITFLLDLGVERDDGSMGFAVEDGTPGSGLKRIAAHFQFHRACRVAVNDATFEFRAGESIRLFFSYRHTPALVHTLMERHGLRVLDQWITKSGEEGVFLYRR